MNSILTFERSPARTWLAVAAFTLLTALTAQIEVRIGDFVPFTLQVFAVVLAGLVLGARAGALSQLAYLLLIRLNLPLAAGGVGAAALTGPTAGYLIGFVAAALVVGWLVEHGAEAIWQRWLAGMVGVGVIYALGLLVLMSLTQMDFSAAWAVGAAPFIIFDLVKVAVAVSLSAAGRTWLRR